MSDHSQSFNLSVVIFCPSPDDCEQVAAGIRSTVAGLLDRPQPALGDIDARIAAIVEPFCLLVLHRVPPDDPMIESLRTRVAAFGDAPDLTLLPHQIRLLRFCRAALLNARGDHAGAMKEFSLSDVREALADTQTQARYAEFGAMALATAQRNSERWPEALESLDFLLRPDGGRLYCDAASLDKGLCLDRFGEHAKAIEVLSDLVTRLEQSEGPGSDCLLASAYLNRGAAYCDAGKYDDAISDAKKALAMKNHWADAHCNLGTALYLAGRSDEALHAYNEAIRLTPDHPGARGGRANALTRLGLAGDAIPDVKFLAERKPKDWETIYNLGTTQLDAGRVLDAAISLEEAVRLNPLSDAAHCNLASAYARLGRDDDAMDHFRRALAVNAKLLSAYMGITAGLGKAGRLRDELKFLSDNEFVQSQPDLLYNRGRLEEMLQMRDAAAKDYEAAIELRPGYAQAMNNLALIRIDQGRLSDAEILLDAAIRSAPGVVEPYCVRAQLSRRRGEYGMALQDADLAIAADVNCCLGWAAKAKALEGLDQVVDAVNAQTTAVDKAACTCALTGDRQDKLRLGKCLYDRASLWETAGFLSLALDDYDDAATVVRGVIHGADWSAIEALAETYVNAAATMVGPKRAARAEDLASQAISLFEIWPWHAHPDPGYVRDFAMALKNRARARIDGRDRKGASRDAERLICLLQSPAAEGVFDRPRQLKEASVLARKATAAADGAALTPSSISVASE